VILELLIFMYRAESTRATTFIVSLKVNTERGWSKSKETFRNWGDGEGGEKRNFRNSNFRYKMES
jgi:hypothetical protein